MNGSASVDEPRSNSDKEYIYHDGKCFIFHEDTMTLEGPLEATPNSRKRERPTGDQAELAVPI